MNSLHVSLDFKWKLSNPRIFGKVGKIGCEFYSLFDGLVLLNSHDCFDSFLDIESGDVLPELTCLELGIIKKVLYKELHEVC